MKRLLLILIFVLALPLNAFDYETNVHQEITKKAIASSNIRQYLINNLNISLDDIFNGEKGSKWMESGSKWEDDNITMRWLNHFYDPTTGRGLNAGIITFGEPSLQWAKSSPNNQWDWAVARLDYYRAITSANKNDREKFFADLFRGLGQIIHLVQDLAVPAHTRNDPHNIPFIESQREMYELYTQYNALTYDGYPAVDNTIFNSFDTFWINSGKGLAEFTNRNFLSRDTNIDDNKYALPVSIGEGITTEKVYDPNVGWINVEVKYFQGYVTDNYLPSFSRPLTRLSSLSYFDFETQKLTGQRVYSLNDKIHKEYASLLIPRAVGYSAGLLNYFFRGEMDMIPDEEKGSGYVIVNNTDEDMSGTFELWYDNKDDERKPVKSWTLAISKKSSGNNKSTNITFTPPDDAKEPGKYMLVFRGKLGSEEDAVVGKEISLLPPLVFLIYRGNNGNDVYAAWSISDAGKTLKDVDYDLKPYINYWIPYGSRNPSVVKSNDNNRYHTYTVENIGIDEVYQPKYGRVVNEVLIGVRNSYIGVDFDYNLDYLGYGSNYICSGRQSSYYDKTEGIIKDLELWKIDNTHGQIRYKVRGGQGQNLSYEVWEERNGAIINFSSSNDIYAVISKDKIIGFLGEIISNNVSLVKTPGYTIRVCPTRCDFDDTGNCNSNAMEITSTGHGRYSLSINNGRYFYFGSVQIDYNGQESFSDLTYSTGETCVCDFRCGDITFFYDTTWASESQSSWDVSTITPIDYDNINGDETFILFYAKSGSRDWSQGDGHRTQTYSGGEPFEIEWYIGDVTSYYIAYRLKNGSLNKEEICWNGLVTTRTQIGTGSICDESTWSSTDTGWVGPEQQGQRISNISSKATDKYLLYSFILEDYTGGVSQWTFAKRILGIIDIKTGTRTEHEVNDDLLGQYKDTFDKTLPSAIGLHNGSVKK